MRPREGKEDISLGGLEFRTENCSALFNVLQKFSGEVIDAENPEIKYRRNNLARLKPASAQLFPLIWLLSEPRSAPFRKGQRLFLPLEKWHRPCDATPP
jgi:hypothetical protein